jgi:hypothetical protein
LETIRSKKTLIGRRIEGKGNNAKQGKMTVRRHVKKQQEIVRSCKIRINREKVKNAQTGLLGCAKGK